jgi:hypothetical protein
MAGKSAHNGWLRVPGAISLSTRTLTCDLSSTEVTLH